MKRLSPQTIHRLAPSASPQIALTFDDGPDADSTERILDLLEKYRVPACFFLIGQKLGKQSPLARRILAKGHIVGNHSLSHRWGNAFAKRTLLEEIQGSQKIFEDRLGLRPRFFRPPRGLLAPWLRSQIHALEMDILFWTQMPGDYYFWHSPKLMEKRILKKLRAGDILVFHDGLNLFEGIDRSKTLQGLHRIIPLVQDRGFEFVRLDRGIDHPAYF